MKDLTGFEKFALKTTETAVQIRPKSNTTSVTRKTEQPDRGVEPPAEPTTQEEPRKAKRGRPFKAMSLNAPKQVPVNFLIDEDLKQILENMKYITHKSTIKGVILEAIDLLLDKYNMEK